MIDNSLIEKYLDQLNEEKSFRVQSIIHDIVALGPLSYYVFTQGLSRSSIFVQQNCLFGLGLVRWQGVTHTIRSIITNATASENVRWFAIKALSSIQGEESVPFFLSLGYDPSSSIRAVIAESLGDIGDDRASNFLIEHLEDPAELVRYTSAKALGSMKNPNEPIKIGEALITSLSDTSVLVQHASVVALGQLHSAQAAPALVKALLDPRPLWYTAISDALASIGTPIVPYLIDTLDHTNPSIRAGVATALGGIGDSSAVPALTQALLDEDTDVRRAVLGALGNIGDPQPTGAILSLLERDDAVRAEAATALGVIGTRDILSKLYDIKKNLDPAMEYNADYELYLAIKRIEKKDIIR